MLMYILVVLVALIIIFVYFFVRQQKFGRLPDDVIQDRIGSSGAFQQGSFQNRSVTPDLTDGATYFSVSKEFIFKKSKRLRPKQALPSIKTDLHSLNEDVLVWMGHSSYFIQINGKKILVDPVLSGSASPVDFTMKSFNGSDIYSTSDIPALDILFISHDHWDHLDYSTISKIHPNTNSIITGLGTGAHLRRWGIPNEKILEMDWDESIEPFPGFKIHALPARHFSGRGMKRNKALWLSFLLETAGLKIFLGGDSGYDSHFKEIGNRFGAIDLAILECGQYNKSWKHIHMMPEEVVDAAIELHAKQLLPVHWSKFSLSLHDWDEPIRRVIVAANKKNVPIVHPMIGQPVFLRKQGSYTSWWETID
jgi:L-ascorbate metabolism protein UlaG (beta-lactamase superfamily)